MPPTTLTPAGLAAQNATLGRTQFNNGPAQVGTSIAPLPPPGTQLNVDSTGVAIPVSTIGTQPLNIAPKQTQVLSSIANLPGAGTPDAGTTPTTPTTPAAGQTNTFTDKLSGLVAKFTGKAADQKIAEDTATNPINAQITSLGSQLSKLQADTIAGQDNITRFAGTNGAFQSGELNRLNRDSNVQGLLIQSRIDSLKGDVASAKANADAAIEAKYAGIQQDIEGARNDIYKNWSTFSAADKKLASAKLAEYDANDQYAKQNMEDEKAVQALAASALAFNPGNQKVMLAVDEATKSGDLMTATKLLAPYQRDPVATQKATLDLQNQRLQNQLLQAQITKLNNAVTNTKTVDASTVDAGASAVNADKNTVALTAMLTNPDIASGTRTKISDVLGVINAVGDVAGANPDTTKNIVGVNPLNALLNISLPNFLGGGTILPGRQSLKQGESIKNEGYVNGINLKVQQWASGASLTAEQTKQVEKFTPNMNDTDANFRTKLVNLSNFMLTQAKSQLESEGLTFKPAPITSFSDLVASSPTVDQYSSFRSQLQPGELLVNRNGQATAISPNELKPTDIKL